jgi:hypothetical protein
VVLARVIVVLPNPDSPVGNAVVVAGSPVRVPGSVVVELGAAGSAIMNSQLAIHKLKKATQAFSVPIRLYTLIRACCASS